MPLPVFTLAASTLMSKTPVVASVGVNVMVASHLSKTPSIGNDAYTLNVILLTTGVTLKVGTCAKVGVTASARRVANIARTRPIFRDGLMRTPLPLLVLATMVDVDSSSGTFGGRMAAPYPLGRPDAANDTHFRFIVAPKATPG
jgi:hypothetical protein